MRVLECRECGTVFVEESRPWRMIQQRLLDHQRVCRPDGAIDEDPRFTAAMRVRRS